MKERPRHIFHLKLDDWTWWAWTFTVILLAAGLSGYDVAYIGAMALTGLQGLILLFRERHPTAFPVQLRVAYLLLLLVCYLPSMRWLYWLPTMGTFALVVFGYCLMARMLSLLPWNRREPCTLSRLRRTFLSAPDIERVKANPAAAGCAGGMCTIEAQVAPADSRR